MRLVEAFVGLAVLIGVGAKCAEANTIQITPGSQITSTGQNVYADVVASGFVTGAAPSIGAYDLNINFDPAILSFVGVSFGTGLDVLGLGSIQSVTPGSGTVELFELSLDLTTDLNYLQPDSFRLAELTFRAVGEGTSPLALSAVAISDADGNDLPVTLQGASVQVGASQPMAVTPEPASALLCATGLMTLLAGLMVRRSVAH